MAQHTAPHGGGALPTLAGPRTDVLDNAVRSALTGPHAAFAERVGAAARYPDDVYAFAALADGPQPGNSPRGGGVVRGEAIRAAPSRARTKEVTAVPRAPHAVHLHSRPHIDLQRVAGALCRS